MRKSAKENDSYSSVSIVDHNGKETEIDLNGALRHAEQLSSSQMEVVRLAPPDINITKAKVTKDRTLDVGYNEYYSDGGYNVIPVKNCNYLVHDDLKEAFKKLIPHLIILCDTFDKKMHKGFEAEPEDYILEEYGNFTIGGFSISGSGDTEGVVIFGTKEKDGRFINLLTPFIKWQSDAYAFCTDLHNAIQDCKDAVKDYMNGKHASKQLEMEFDGPAEEINTEE